MIDHVFLASFDLTHDILALKEKMGCSTSRNLFRSTLLAQEALPLANANLENARKTQDQKRALKYCDEARTTLRRIDISASTTDQSQLDQIITAYREHGRVLENLGFSEKAKKSNSEADKLR